MKANEVSNLNSWDQKYATLLQKLDDLQEEKDHPKKQIVDVESELLLVKLVDFLRALSYFFLTKTPTNNAHRFRERFKSMIDQYELRELHFHSLMRTKELEVQYNMARFERERKRAEAEVALSQRLQEQVQELSRSEAKMQAEMKLILEKIEQTGLPP